MTDEQQEVVFGVLGIALMVLDVLGLVDWSWLIVMTPVWVPAAVIAAFLSSLGEKAA